MKKHSRQQGYLLLIAIVLILIVGFISAVCVYLSVSNSRGSSDQYQSTQAFYVAESGLQDGIHTLLKNSTAATCGTLSLTNLAVSTIGYYTVNVGALYYPSPATTLSAAITATATTIPVTSSANYDPKGGILLIDKEVISYAGISNNNLVQAVRGINGSTATTHVSGTPVGQYQCRLTSQGGVPNLTAPTNLSDPLGKRTVTSALSLEEGWTAGNNSASNWAFAHWNIPNQGQWTNASVTTTSTTSLTGLALLSYGDAWAVGQSQGSNLLLIHWNGSTWTRQLPAVTLNSDLYSVTCTSTANCWAVGNVSGSNPVIEQWNGASWSQVTPAANVNAALNSVVCNSSTDCWAVGNYLSPDPLIEHWNGTNWSQTLPSSSLPANLNSVTCNSSTDCWAVGTVSAMGPLIVHWNGTTWSSVSGPASSAALNSVTCTSTSNCWAVGNAVSTNLTVYNWNGTAWSKTTVSISSTNNLYSVACASSSDCWAVGANSFVLHWNGSAWSQSTIGGSLASSTLKAVAILGNNTSSLQSVWQESF